MKRNFYRNLLTIAVLFIITTAQAQVTVDYQVDINTWLAGGGTLAVGGMRVGGTFDDRGATLTNGDTIPNWTPSSDRCAMMDIGGNVWSIIIEYPDSSIGKQQDWKFVNGDWGGDEGQSGITQLDSTCGIGNGYGGFNRFIIVPSENSVYHGNFDECGTLTPTGISTVQTGGASLDVYPNPANEFTQVTYKLTSNDNVVVTLRGFTGEILETLVNKPQVPGAYSFNLNTGDLASGMYFVQINAGGVTFDKRFVVNR
ncbi:MAG: T9SS type A sorting domain-containing protein [Chitinophagales bacterium]